MVVVFIKNIKVGESFPQGDERVVGISKCAIELHDSGKIVLIAFRKTLLMRLLRNM